MKIKNQIYYVNTKIVFLMKKLNISMKLNQKKFGKVNYSQNNHN